MDLVKSGIEPSQKDILFSLADGMTLEDAAALHGLSIDAARRMLAKMRMMIATHPDNFDRYSGGAATRDNPEFQHSAENSNDRGKAKNWKSDLLNDLLEDFSTDELRGLGRRLLNISDAVDQNWRPEQVRSAFSWPSEAARIERNSLELAKVAQSIIRFRHDRAKFIPADALGEPAWDMLLELFCQFAGGAAISSKSLSIVSGAPPTTALRQIAMLEAEGLIRRRKSETDKRVTLIDLTRKGVIAVGRALERVP